LNLGHAATKITFSIVDPSLRLGALVETAKFRCGFSAGPSK
jgi:hypothetical protein